MKRLLLLLAILFMLTGSASADVQPPPEGCPTTLVFNYFAEFGYTGCLTEGTVVIQLSPYRAPLIMRAYDPITVSWLNQKWGRAQQLYSVLKMYTWDNPRPFQQVFAFDLSGSPGIELLIVKTGPVIQ